MDYPSRSLALVLYLATAFTLGMFFKWYIYPGRLPGLAELHATPAEPSAQQEPRRGPEPSPSRPAPDEGASTAENPPAPETGRPGTLPPPRYQPRDEREWQGMRVDLSLQATCGPGHPCGLAMACLGSQCGPCSRDADCEGAERCVLDHCLRQELVGCRSYADCPSGQLCVLSGISSDTRGNGELTATCRGGEGEEQPGAASPPRNPAGGSQHNVEAPLRMVPMNELAEEAREAIRNTASSPLP